MYRLRWSQLDLCWKCAISVTYILLVHIEHRGVYVTFLVAKKKGLFLVIWPKMQTVAKKALVNRAAVLMVFQSLLLNNSHIVNCVNLCMVSLVPNTFSCKHRSPTAQLTKRQVSRLQKMFENVLPFNAERFFVKFSFVSMETHTYFKYFIPHRDSSPMQNT